MARRGVGDAVEAEPVMATIRDGVLTLDLDDADRLVLDFDELLAVALGEHMPFSVEAA